MIDGWRIAKRSTSRNPSLWATMGHPGWKLRLKVKIYRFPSHLNGRQGAPGKGWMTSRVPTLSTRHSHGPRLPPRDNGPPARAESPNPRPALAAHSLHPTARDDAPLASALPFHSHGAHSRRRIRPRARLAQRAAPQPSSLAHATPARSSPKSQPPHAAKRETPSSL